MYSRTRLLLLLLSLFVLIGCSDRSASDSGVLEARAQGSLPELAARRLWHGPGVDAQGSVSPDGRFLSFSDWREGEGGNLAVRELATGDVRILAKATAGMTAWAMAHESLIAPDGKQAAFVWEDPAGSSLRIIPIAGGQPRTLYSNAEARYVDLLAWSPDGAQILVEINMLDRTNRLALIAAESGAARILKSFDWRPVQAAAFSPDGRYIVYGFAPDLKNVQRDVFLLSADGSKEITIVSHAADDRVLGWPRGGQAVWFLSDRSGSPGIWSIDVVDGRVQGQAKLIRPDLWRLVDGLGFDQAGSLYYAVSPTARQVYTTALESSTARLLVPPTPVAEGVNTQHGADWSPDGKMLAYATRSQGVPNRIIIRTMQSGDVRELTPSMRYIQSVAWFPDGQSLFARGQDEEGRYGAYRIDARTGATLSAHRRPNLGGFTTVTVAPDGSAIYYSGRVEGGKSGESSIIRRDLRTDQEQPLHSFRGNGGGPSVSPDGRHLAFSLSEPGPDEPASIWIVGADGTDSRVVYRLPKDMASPPYRGPIVWTKDGHLLFVATGSSGTSFWRVPVAGGEATKIPVDLSSIRSFRLHPDGKRLAFDAGEPSYEIWVLHPPSNTSAAR